MSAEKYHLEISGIKEQLQRCRPESILSQVLDHLHFSQAEELQASGMPWIVLFLLKLTMLGGDRDGRDITKHEFHQIANRLFNIQHLACPLDCHANIELQLRPMILQQAWYQRDLTEEVKAFTRQKIWFAGENTWYDEVFFKAYGVSLENFYHISLYLIIHVGRAAKGVVGVNLYDLIFHLTPNIPIAQVFHYLTLVGVRGQDLPAFFDKHRLKDEKNQQSEFFQPSPLRYKPLLINGEDVFVYNFKLFSRGLSMLVPDLLKKAGRKFKNQFGPDMEAYVGSLLNSSGAKYFSEGELKRIFSANSVKDGKVCDYLVEGDVSVLLECKAIEPGDIVSSVYDPVLLKEHLKGSFIKGVEQCQETAKRLSLTKEFKGKKFISLIITHEDFWFASADDIARFIDGELEDRIKTAHGDLPIALENILFITVDTFEHLMELQSRGEIQLGEFIADCIESLQGQGGKRFTASHIAREKLQGWVVGHANIVDKGEQWVESFRVGMAANKQIWQGKALELIHSRAALLRCLHQNFEEQARVEQQ